MGGPTPGFTLNQIARVFGIDVEDRSRLEVAVRSYYSANELPHTETPSADHQICS